MCGICGVVVHNGITDNSKDIVYRMMDELSHRGPDGQGMIAGDSFVFGHRRLSIIDLDLGIQPMLSDDRQIILVFNGEIYNYIELRQELSRKGIHFKTFSDTEVLLKLYELEGEKCLKRLNGMFAFAIFDQRQNKLFAARDHFGIKPFYYSILPDGTFLFASEVKALFKHPSLRPTENMAAMQEYLTFQFCLEEKTLFKNVFKLLPGHVFKWHLNDSGGPVIEKFWNPNFEVDTYHTEEYFLDTLLMRLQDSMRQQMRSDVPVGAYLSGGLDSSTVTTLAAMQYGEGMECFTGKFAEGSAYDESMYAQLVADSVNGICNEIVPSAQNFVDILPDLIYHLDEPVAGIGVFPQYLVSRLASQKVKVVLGGQGGDEIFGGYARYLVAYLEQCLKGSIYQTQEEGKHIVSLNSIISSLPLLKEYVPMLKDFWSDGLFEPMDRRYFRLVDRSHDIGTLLSSQMKSAFDKEKIYETFSSVFNRPDTKSYLNKMLNFDQQTLLPSLLQIEDRVSMAVGIESRVPLLDYRIVELANSMPPSLKFKTGQPKWALRQTMKNLLPERIVNRRDKMGFPVPIREWLTKGPVRDFVGDILLGDKSRNRGIFNVQSIEWLLNNEKPYARQLWGALCIEMWYQTFIDRG